MLVQNAEQAEDSYYDRAEGKVDPFFNVHDLEGQQVFAETPLPNQEDNK